MPDWLTRERLRRPKTAGRFLDKAWLSKLKPALIRWLGLHATWHELPVAARVYLLGIWLASVTLLVWAIRELPWSHVPLHLFVLVAGLIFGLSQLGILLRPGEVQVTLEMSASIAAIMLLPPPSIPPLVLLSKSLAEMCFERPWYKKAFNVGQWMIVNTILAWTYQHLASGNASLLGSDLDIAAVLTVWIGQYALNSGLVVLAISLASGYSPFTVWRANYRDVIYHLVFTAPLGTLLALLIQEEPLAVVLVLPPLFMMYRALELTADLRRRTVEALKAFANSIDARDPSTHQHSERVAELARAIAIQMGLPPDEVETIHLSARVHDLGKVGIPDAILFKPGELSDEEYEIIKEHPVISGQIVESFALFQAGYDIIRHHHERWDGRGYPDGLSGEAIPLGARIISVADAYDAMISDRPYRAGLPHEEAVRRIVENRGRQFDPNVVDAFLAVMSPARQPAPDDARVQTDMPHHTPSVRAPLNGGADVEPIYPSNWLRAGLKQR